MTRASCRSIAKMRYCMAVRWHIRCYVSPSGAEEIRLWYEGQSRQVQDKFYSRLRTLAQLDWHDWRLPLFRALHGECLPLGELRFKVRGVQYRPLGYRGSGNTFTLVFCAMEKSNKFVPRTACADGLARKALIDNGRAITRPFWLPLE